MVGPGRLGGDPKGRGTGTVLCESGSVRAGPRENIGAREYFFLEETVQGQTLEIGNLGSLERRYPVPVVQG